MNMVQTETGPEMTCAAAAALAHALQEVREGAEDLRDLAARLLAAAAVEYGEQDGLTRNLWLDPGPARTLVRCGPDPRSGLWRVQVRLEPGEADGDLPERPGEGARA